MIQSILGPGGIDVLPGFPAYKLEFAGFTELAADAAGVTVTFNQPYRYLIMIARIAGNAGAGGVPGWQFNGDTGNNYGGAATKPADGVATAQTSTNKIIVSESTAVTPRTLKVAFAAKDAAGRIGRLRGFGIDDTESIGTAIQLSEHGGIWANTTALFTSVTMNGGATSLLAGSNLLVYGINAITS